MYRTVCEINDKKLLPKFLGLGFPNPDFPIQRGKFRYGLAGSSRMTSALLEVLAV